MRAVGDMIGQVPGPFVETAAMRGGSWGRVVWTLLLACVVAGCARGTGENDFSGETYLVVWAGDADRKDSDFLAIIDADWESRSYGKVLRTIPVKSKGNEPYGINTEQRFDRRVFTTGLLTGRTFVFDLRDPMKGGLALVDTPGANRTLTAPASVVTIPGGKAVVMCADRIGYRGEPREVLGAPGGLSVFGNDGRFQKELTASGQGTRGTVVAPTGGAVRASMSALVTTNHGHGLASTTTGDVMPGITVQLWSVPDLALKKTITLDAGPRGEENLGPMTPQFLRQRPFVFVNTHEGGALYVSDSLGIPDPIFRLVTDFGAGALPSGAAITPDDHFYVTALTGQNKVVALDVTDPFKPKAVSSLRFDRVPGATPESGDEKREGGPSGLAMSLDGRRIAVADYTIDVPSYTLDGDRRVHMLRLDRATGKLRFDNAFKDENTEEVGIDFNRDTWPHGKTGPARPRGLLFVSAKPDDEN